MMRRVAISSRRWASTCWSSGVSPRTSYIFLPALAVHEYHDDKNDASFGPKPFIQPILHFANIGQHSQAIDWNK
ncbi:hypothetical protein CEXT_342571 [Caerostris extrusa]|uniref:Uncharacterized protein n=1 Tax=Caerostris extrusa TaxID=172846 RepID=A0AAV4TQY0_CAEEX|nr:hypothetical protein CEXT_342571 [Caerostris extrusa]